MRRVGRYSRISVRLLILITIGILFMLGRYVVRRFSGRLQAPDFDTIDLPPVEEPFSGARGHNATRTGMADGALFSPASIVPAVEEPEIAELIPTSEEPINETVSPMIADSSVLEEVEVPEGNPLSQPVATSEMEAPLEDAATSDVVPESVEAGSGEKAAEAAPTNPGVTQPEAYCVKCRTRRGMKDARRIVTKNNRNAMEGICPVCGTRLFRFIAASS